MSNDFQTHFVTTSSPAHHGHQDFLHRDVHLHLAGPNGQLVGNGPLAQSNHQPLSGQTQIPDFMLEKKPGIW